jgi:DNA-binding transcriptional MerR regulator
LLDASSMKNTSIKKLYYSISEVSKITGLKQYVLRFWESEFADLKPAKNRAGNRIYRLSDIKLIFLIKKLLYEDKYTIEGARQKLKMLNQIKTSQMTMPFQEKSEEDFISSLKKDLHDILDILDGKK